MSFNPDKCEVLRVTNKRKHTLRTQYKIHDRILNTVETTKYLGVTIQSKLNWKPHINNITKKANNIRAFLQRNLSRCPRPVKEQAYKTYVRPILEYASTVWDPHTIELTNQLEMVQSRAARFVTADYRRRHSVTLLLNQFQWQTLLQRRTHSKVTMLYRIHHQLVAIPAGPPYIIYSNTTTRGHHLQLQQHHCCINSYQHSFSPSVVNYGTNCHQTQWGLLRSLNSRTDLPPPRCIKSYYGPCFISTSPCTVFTSFTNVLMFTWILSLHTFYAYFTHGPNTSASAQYDNTRGAWLTQEGCTVTERKERKNKFFLVLYVLHSNLLLITESLLCAVLLVALGSSLHLTKSAEFRCQ